MSSPPQQVDALLPAALLAAAEQDVRSLLASIELGAATLEARTDEGELAQTGRIVGGASRQLSATLRELIETAGRIVEGRTPVGPVDLTRLLDQVRSDCGLPPQACGAPRQSVHVATNEVLVRHLFYNLVANAVAASRPDQVTIEVTPGPQDVAVAIHNPASEPDEASSTPQTVSHLGRGRGLRIVRILADAANIDYQHTLHDGVHTARLRVPDRVRHPSLLAPPADREQTTTATVTPLDPPGD